MTQGSNRIFDDFAKLASDATSVAQSVRKEMETAVRAQAERFLSDMDLVQRDEHDAVKEMAAAARDEAEDLKTRLAALEARVATLEAGSGSAAPSQSETPGTPPPGE
ncbi:accessory factor UbiK family protein [Amorphus orientalis]|uniref:BMFP domain-containing protein YqiC n=1 Tax=Amorphus orientalis TaxID=649198 RepID=A0AAE3VKP7_9HYPH|nr:accessory factor UbiK family protein [Amorphus orientalis]MDQ0314229.1 BMFP domain-containing protein YqiC [Amorphus orientalis]